ncbi:MAG: cob(I)yrinic acid a,c-diamide adenosyltransferase [Chromatiales bacterium]|nr:cob(I)yrinic acid a,c-diamide adenosyltransferase [Chromatiales bacterium]
MGYRLSRIYTRTGDQGSTGMADGRRLPKDHPRVAAMGDLDELNSAIGLLLASPFDDPELARDLLRVQHDLFDLGGELAMPEAQLLPDDATARLEAVIDRLNTDLPPLKEFILPGGSPAAAQCHLARAVCRRAERSLVALGALEPIADRSRAYVNRLSDLLFVAARRLSRLQGGSEILWDRNRV